MDYHRTNSDTVVRPQPEQLSKETRPPHKVCPPTIIVIDDGPSQCPTRSTIYYPPQNGDLAMLHAAIQQITNPVTRTLVRQLTDLNLDARQLELTKLRNSHWNLQLENESLRVRNDRPSLRVQVRSTIYQDAHSDDPVRLQAAMQQITNSTTRALIQQLFQLNTRESELTNLRNSHCNLQLVNESLREDVAAIERRKYLPRHKYLAPVFTNPIIEQRFPSFFHLPTEVRDMFYDAIIAAATCATKNWRKLGSVRKYSGLSSTCKRVDAEFLSRVIPGSFNRIVLDCQACAIERFKPQPQITQVPLRFLQDFKFCFIQVKIQRSNKCTDGDVAGRSQIDKKMLLQALIDKFIHAKALESVAVALQYCYYRAYCNKFLLLYR